MPKSCVFQKGRYECGRKSFTCNIKKFDFSWVERLIVHVHKKIVRSGRTRPPRLIFLWRLPVESWNLGNPCTFVSIKKMGRVIKNCYKFHVRIHYYVKMTIETRANNPEPNRPILLKITKVQRFNTPWHIPFNAILPKAIETFRDPQPLCLPGVILLAQPHRSRVKLRQSYPGWLDSGIARSQIRDGKCFRCRTCRVCDRVFIWALDVVWGPEISKIPPFLFCFYCFISCEERVVPIPVMRAALKAVSGKKNQKML